MPDVNATQAANKKSASDLAWGVLPAGDYLGPDDPRLIGDAVEFDSLPIPAVEVPPGVATAAQTGGIVTQHTLARFAAFGKLDRAARTALLAGRAGATRFVRFFDGSPKTTTAINAGASVLGLAGGVAMNTLVKPAKKKAAG